MRVYLRERVIVLPIIGSRTRRSTRTTTVFCILLLVTRPTSLRWFLPWKLDQSFRRLLLH